MSPEKREDIRKRYSSIQDEIDYYLNLKEEAEKKYIKARTELNRLETKLESLSKEMIRLIVSTYNKDS